MNVYEKLNYFLQHALFWLGRRGQMTLPQGVTMEGERLTAFTYRVYTTILHLLYKVQTRTLTLSEIATAMGANTKSQKARISKAIRQLGQTVFIFDGVLVEGETVKTPLIVVKRIGHGRTLKLEIAIPFEIWKLQRSGKYQVLDYPYYRNIETDIARRIWEYLEKRRNLCKSGKFEIDEAKLCSYIPITSKRRRDRIKVLKKHLDVLHKIGYANYYIKDTKIVFCYLHKKKVRSETTDFASVSSTKTATNLCSTASDNPTNAAVFDDSFVATCLYDSFNDPEVGSELQDTLEQIAAFSEAPRDMIKNDHINDITNPNMEETLQLKQMGITPPKPKTSKDVVEEKAQIAKEQNDNIDKLMELVKEKTDAVKTMLAKAMVAQGKYHRDFQELSAAIKYTNKSKCDNYFGFLRKCILGKWYESTLKSIEEKEAREAVMAERYEEIQAESQEKKSLDAIRDEFLEDCKSLSVEFRQQLKDKAIAENKGLYQKQAYCEALVHHFAGKYPVEVIKYISFMNTVWSLDEVKEVKQAVVSANKNSLGSIFENMFRG